MALDGSGNLRLRETQECRHQTNQYDSGDLRALRFFTDEPGCVSLAVAIQQSILAGILDRKGDPPDDLGILIGFRAADFLDRSSLRKFDEQHDLFTARSEVRDVAIR